MCRRKLNLFLFLILAFLAQDVKVSGQMNYRPGVVVTNEGETLRGLVREQGTLKSMRYCKFKAHRNAETITYFPEQIKAYEISGYKHYRSLEWEDDNGYSKIFSEILLEGSLDLYHNWRKKNLAYMIRKENGSLMALQNEEFTLWEEKETGSTMAYGSKLEGFITLYRDSLYSLFEDQPEIRARVAETDYRMKPIMGITRDYIEAGCTGENCISYEKNPRLNRDRFGFFAGAQISKLYYLESAQESELTFSYPVGVFYQIPLSWFSERLYFQTELIYRYLDYDPIINLPNRPPHFHTKRFMHSHVLSIPLLFSYRFSVKAFSPVIGAGNELGFNVSSYGEYHYYDMESDEDVIDEYSFHKINKEGWFLDAGIDYQFGEGLSLFSKIRIQSYRNKIIADGVENNLIFKVAEGEETRAFVGTLFLGIRF